MNERRKRWRTGVRWLAPIWVAAAIQVAGAADAPGFSEDFGKAEVGKLPDGFLLIGGDFAVKADGNDRFLETPGAPLDDYALMFGPSGKEDWGAQANVFGTGAGRRFPVLGLALNGFAGFRVQLAPAKKALELLKGDDVVATAPYAWESGTWTQLRIQIRKAGAGWKVEGKAWKNGTTEPATWAVAFDDTAAPLAGRPVIWGKPYSGTPIRFDDLKVVPAK